MVRILIAYGIGEGQTARISEYIAQTVGDRGHDVETVDIKNVPTSFQLEGYDAVMVGASTHMGQHEDYVQDFGRKQGDPGTLKQDHRLGDFWVEELAMTIHGGTGAGG